MYENVFMAFALAIMGLAVVGVLADLGGGMDDDYNSLP